MLTFNNTRSSHKRNRTTKKFPRHKLKDFNTIPKNLKEWGYCKHNWNDDDYTYTKGNMKRFLMSNLGKPIDTVYSKFLKRWKSFENPKEEFYHYIKDSIVESIGGFYLVNGILNYKTPTKKKLSISKADINRERFKNLDMSSLINTLYSVRVPQCLGRFWVGDTERTIYMDNHIYVQDSYSFAYKNRQQCGIVGVGYGLDVDIKFKSTGGRLDTYTPSSNSNPSIYFYYRI